MTAAVSPRFVHGGRTAGMSKEAPVVTCRSVIHMLAVLAALAALPLAPAAGRAQGSGLDADWHGIFGPCAGDCAVHVYGGRQTTTSPGMAFGFADVTQGDYGFVLPTPVWAYDWENSGIVGFAFSREFASLAYNGTDLLGLESEVGVAKRFGDQTEAEYWAALYLRWKWFPWNDVVKTSFAISTGLNYASGISDYELRVSGNGEGSQLMHFFAPEITLALPDQPDREVVFRMHHRSGIQDDEGLPGLAIFNYADTGATFATLGVRYKF